ncbi:bifunctional folylpolyglutamate synthase/dihydrofolate synthase [Candidatus Woesearchaeota archaeon]|nr:bifunctional folylpolyglutamate synthase/dihydrofolate synthase [Candidatus Woesearchaeota archaeon]
MNYDLLIEELFHLRKHHGINPTLDHIKNVLGVLNNPHLSLICIHVAGTNGKGSVCAMLDSILQKAGYSVGRYTSPHLVDVRERIVINDQQISKEDFLRLVLFVQKKAKEVHTELTFFEIMTAVAFLYFAERKVDYAVIEAGLGGTWDATNVIMPKLCILTSISMDHTEFLGNTVEEITKDKCGIIKKECVVVIPSDQPALSLIEQKVREQKASLQIAISYEGKIALQGSFQKINAGIAFTAAKALDIEEKTIKEGLATAFWPGRCQFLDNNFLVDGAHNEAGVKVLAEYVNSLRKNYSMLTLLFGVGKKKDYDKMISLFPEHDVLIVTKSSHEDALDPSELGQGIVIPDLQEALESAQRLTPKGLIVCFGSLYLVGEVMHAFEARKKRS